MIDESTVFVRVHKWTRRRTGVSFRCKEWRNVYLSGTLIKMGHLVLVFTTMKKVQSRGFTGYTMTDGREKRVTVDLRFLDCLLRIREPLLSLWSSFRPQWLGVLVLVNLLYSRFESSTIRWLCNPNKQYRSSDGSTYVRS